MKYDRHIFRILKQEEGQKFDKFLVRLRHQAEKCKSANVEEHLINQITEKCFSIELKKRILAAGDNINLEKIIAKANSLEVVNRQLQQFDIKNTTTPHKI